MKWLKYLSLILAILIAPVANATKIVVVGDSLSRQDYLTENSWPTMFQRSLPPSITVENLARDGYTLYRTYTVPSYPSGLTVLQKAISLKADIYLVALGYNDIVNNSDNRNVQQVIGDFGTVMSQLKATGAQVYYVGILAQQSLASQNWWLFWETVVPSQGTNFDGTFIMNYYKIQQMAGTSDGIHPTRLGSALQAGYVLKYMIYILGLPLPNVGSWEDPEQAYIDYTNNSPYWQALLNNWK